MKLVESILTMNPCYTAGRKITVKGLMLHSVGCPQPKASVFVNGWNIYPLDFASHVTDVLMNTTSATDIHSRVSEHVRLLHEARSSRKPISVGGYLRKLGDEYMTRGGPYRAGFRRICLSDAFALLKEDILPVYQLNSGQYDRPLGRGALRAATHQDSFGIRITDSSDYDRWQHEMLVEHYEQLQLSNRTRGSEARG